jgi:fumarate reductase subunit C
LFYWGFILNIQVRSLSWQEGALLFLDFVSNPIIIVIISLLRLGPSDLLLSSAETSSSFWLVTENLELES